MPPAMVTRMHATEEAPDGTDAIDRSRVAYTLRDTARLLSLSVRKVRYMVQTGELSSFKVGVARRVHGTAIEEYVRHQSEPTAQQAS